MRLHQFIALTAAAVATLFATPATALGTNYDPDGTTTYCWQIPQPTTNTKLTEADRVTGYAGKLNCPVAMTVTLSKSTVEVNENVMINWTVVADFSQRNLVNMTKVVYGADVKGNTAHIVHSNIHSCAFGSGCDPFNDGEGLTTKTTNMIANFSDNFASFVHSEKFTKAGDYSILAHIVLPDVNASKRFDYAVYTELVVKDAPATLAPVATSTPASAPTPAAAASSDSSGLSTGALIGIIIAAVVVVALVIALVFRKRQRNLPSPNQGYMAPPAYDVSVQLLANNNKNTDVRAGQSDITDTATSADFQSARSGPAVGGARGRPSQNLDGTGASNASGSSYASRDRESQVSGLNRSHGTAASAAAMYREGSLASNAANSTGTRPRRVDSDVEL